MRVQVPQFALAHIDPPSVPATAGSNQFLGFNEPPAFLNGGLAGTGTAQMIGGSGPTTFLFADGNTGGAANVENFLPGQDFVAVRNYGSNAVQDALTGASVVACSTTITLADNSRITFIGVANLTQSDFR
jgi:hypothetical protein